MDSIYKLLEDAGVPSTETGKCLQWAFGVDYMQIQRKYLPKRWNDKHSDIFKAYGTEYFDEFIKKIGESYVSKDSSAKEKGESV